MARWSPLRRTLLLVLLWIKRGGVFRNNIKNAFVWYFGFELLFFCRFKYLHNYINKYMPNTIINTKSTHTNHSYMERLLTLMTKYSKLHQNGSQGWISEWFNNANINNICQGNVYEFLWWSLFVSAETNKTLSLKENQWRHNFVNNAYKKLESNIGHTFQKGYNDKITFLANTKPGPIQSVYHPLIIYIALYITQKITDFYCSFILGFKYKWINGLKVWYKIPKTSQTHAKPILLIHGIGIFLFPYINFINSILQTNPNQAIICVEIPWISVDVNNYITSNSSYIQHKLPAKTIDFVEIMRKMEEFMTDNIKVQFDWTLIGHSYGTFIVSAIYKYFKNNVINNIQKIPRLVLIDPVCLCLSIPTTVSAIEKTPKDWSLYMLQLFAFKELQISCTLSRFTHWFQYVLFPDDLVNDEFEHIICIATHDKIIPFDVINQGITELNSNYNKQNIQRIDKIVFENKGHAQWLSNKHCIEEVVAAIM